MAKTIDQAWQEHQKAIDQVRSPATGSVDRSGGITDNTSYLDQVVATSGQLREALAGAIASQPENSRDFVAMKLLAGATYDLGLAKELIDKDNAGGGGTQRSGAAVFSDKDLNAILKTPLAEMKAFQVERAVGPRDLAPARNALKKKIETFVTEIPKRSAETAINAMTGAANFGFGPAQQLLGIAAQEVLAQIPQTISKFVGYAVKLIREAILKLWDAFGGDKQKELQDKAKSWFKELMDKKEDFATSLLQRLYGVDDLRKEISAAIDGTSPTVTTERLNKAAEQLDELLARHEKLGKLLGWIVTGIGWAKTPLMGAPPWGPVAAYGVYAGVIGYTIYLGGDYLDSENFNSAWLDHVEGARAIVRTATAAA